MELEQRQAAGTECDKDEEKERVRVIYIEKERERAREWARHRVAGRKALSSFAFLCRHLTYVPAFDLFGVVRECLCDTIYDARGTTLYCSQGAARLGFTLLVNERKIRKPKCSTGVFETEHRRIRLCAK